MIYAITLILLVLSPDQKPAPAACDPALTALFTPATPRRGRYEVCLTTDTVEASRADGFTYGPVEQLEPLDAFGTAGRYSRPRLAHLYGGRRIAVVRGWRQTADGFESVTLLSPYPDASLEHIIAGTMIIRWTVRAR
jgi:hypothetical protein